MSIGILYERSETDELGINLLYIPFRKVAIHLTKDRYSVRSKGKNYSKTIEDVKVVLNSTKFHALYVNKKDF
jgi:hypothetical protein